MALRAVAFDYGMVLSGHPDPQAHSELRRITGLTHDQLEAFYWVDRHAYDRGDLTGLAFWQKLADDAELTLPPDTIAELNSWDARMWTTVNPAMVAWLGKLKAHGLTTAILSNMGDAVLESIAGSFAWIAEVDVPIWSYQHRLAKPDPAIYELLLVQLGTEPEETLFLDDKLENIQAAQQLGIVGIQFSTVEKLREDLHASGLDLQLPQL